MTRMISSILLGVLLAASVFWIWLWATDRVLRVPLRKGVPTSVVADFAPRTDTAPFAAMATQSEVDAPVRGVVLLIADGMGFSHVTAARVALAGVNGRMFMERLPVGGWLHSHSADELYTDSAAAATAMATGVKTAPGLLGIDAEERPRRTLVEAAQERGMATALVTDSYLWDATPAAFLTHAKRRDYPRVIEQMASAGADLLIGEESTRVPEDDPGAGGLTPFTERDYEVARDLATLEAATRSGRPAVGLFAPGTIAQEQAPDLETLARLAWQRVADDPEGFFLLIETEETDSGAHNGDLERVVGGLRALDEVVRFVTEEAAARGDVLVVVTADHETGGLSILLGEQGEPVRVRWGTGSHTAEPVPLFAYGPGAERLVGGHDNTELARVLSDLLDLDGVGALLNAAR